MSRKKKSVSKNVGKYRGAQAASAQVLTTSPKRKAEAKAAASGSLDDYNRSYVKWSARELDPGSDFSFSKWACTDSRTVEILKFLEEISNKTWGEVLSETSNGHRKHHAQSVETITHEARARLKHLYQDDEFPEELFRFRLSGKVRLWGIRKGSVFCLLWLDQEHRVYPTEKD